MPAAGVANPWTADDYVLSADEKTSIQARRRIHPSLPVQPHRAARIEHEYQRTGAWAYLAAWDIRRAHVFGRCEGTTGIAPFDRLVGPSHGHRPVSLRPPCLLDHGQRLLSSRCRAVERLRAKWPTIIPVHTPVHASWLNQIEIYFSIVQRKVLNPNDFASLNALEARLLHFQTHYSLAAKPFHWTFTRRDLAALLTRMHRAEQRMAA